MKKITFFIGSLGRGGAERVISILANHYCKKGWNVDIALLLNTKVGYELEDKIRIVDLTECGSYVKAMPKWLIKIRRYIKSEHPDRIVSFVGRINLLVLTAKIGLNVKTIVSERNDPKHDGRGKAISFYTNLIYKKADAIVYQTEYEKSCFSKSLDEKGYIIPNPVSVNTYRKNITKYRVVTAGRLLPQKNHSLLIDAVAKLKDEYPNISLYIFGDGALKAELEDKVKSLNLSQNIFLPGNVVELHEKIADAHVFVMSSEYEGLSNALIEAMMIGLPCITTDYPGADELIQDGVNGLIVSRGNIDEMALAIKRIISDETICESLRNGAKEASRKYDTDLVLRQWDAIIE